MSPPAAAPYRPAFPADLASRSGAEALNMVATPRWIGRLALAMAAMVLLGPVAMLFAPWQQTVRGAGKVVAFTPLERQQTIEAPIAGRIVRWWVQEGTIVREGDPLFEIEDIDPQRLERLERELETTVAKLAAYEDKAAQYEQQAANVRAMGDLAVQAASFRLDQAENRVEAADEKLRGALAELHAAEAQVVRNRNLLPSGAISQRQLEIAERDHAKAVASVNEARAGHAAAVAERDSVQREMERTRASADASVNSALAALSDTRGQIEDARASRVRLEGQVSRQQSQLVAAPRDGVVFRLLGASGGEIVSAGQPQVVLVPDTQDRAVELWVDGNDAPLLTNGAEVRLQFEGWPAVQFAGWPSVAVGTFGGRVALIDSTDDGMGSFRIVVTPEPGAEWPEGRFLRQGVRAKGWILLNEVTIGFEVWRQLNGFPPVIAQEEPEGVARKRLK